MPRPPVLDDVRRAEVLALATYGFSRRAIANYVGCAPNTIANTADRDPDFALRLRRATQQFVCRNVENVQRHAMQSPKNSLWLLERLQPNQFARRSPNSITPAQLNRKFHTWIKALVAAAPPDSRQAVAQAATQLAAQHLSNLDDDTSPPDTDDQADDLPPDDVPSNSQTSAGHSSTAVTTPPAANPHATSVPPVPRDRATSAPPVPSGPASPAATSPPAVPLPTPTSALPASHPLRASPPLSRAELAEACRLRPSDERLVELLIEQIELLLDEGKRHEAIQLYKATGASLTESRDAIEAIANDRDRGGLARPAEDDDHDAEHHATPPRAASPTAYPTATASTISRAATAAMLLLSLLFLGGSATTAVIAGLRPGWAGSSHFSPPSHGQPSDDRDDAGAQPPAAAWPKAGTDATASHASARVEIAQTAPDVTPLLVKNPPIAGTPLAGRASDGT